MLDTYESFKSCELLDRIIEIHVELKRSNRDTDLIYPRSAAVPTDN